MNDNSKESRIACAQVVNTLSSNSPQERELAKAKATVDELIRIGANIADSYDDWWNCGCALAELGPEARDLFHLVSSQSSKYCEAVCEKKWQECLAKRDGRITVATFYKMAQQAGVDLSAISRQFPAIPANPQPCQGNNGKQDRGNGATRYSADNKNNNSQNTPSATPASFIPPANAGMREVRESGASSLNSDSDAQPFYSETFSDKIAEERLPVILRMVTATQQSAEDKDKVLLSAITLFSGNQPATFGIYGEKRVYPPLYLIINAPSGARKGIITDCTQLLMPVEYELKQQNERAQEAYQSEMAVYNALGRKEQAAQTKPVEPKYRSLFVAANSSATSLYQDLADNGDRGTIFETEADTMTQALKQDYGNYSEGLRKAFHGERISYSRRKEHERVCVEHPQLAIMMTCTPQQICRLIPADEVENGMGNRFLYYCSRGERGWRNPFTTCDAPLESRLFEVGKCFKQLYDHLLSRASRPLQVVLSEEQQRQFNDYFSPLLEEQTGLHGEPLNAFIFRMGLSAFRMMMIFTVLRCYERSPMTDSETQALVCSDQDFQTVMTIINCLVNHTVYVYTHLLPQVTYESQAVAALSSQERTLYQALEDEFTTQTAFETAVKLQIEKRTAERYLGNFVKASVVRRIRNGLYAKIKSIEAKQQ